MFVELGGKSKRTKLKKNIKIVELQQLITRLYMLEENKSDRLHFTYFEEGTELDVILDEDLVEMMDFIAESKTTVKIFCKIEEEAKADANTVEEKKEAEANANTVEEKKEVKADAITVEEKKEAKADANAEEEKKEAKADTPNRHSRPSDAL